MTDTPMSDADTIQELRKEVSHLQAMLEGRWADAQILSTSVEDGGFRALIQTPFGSLLAHFCSTALRSEGAENFVELEADHPEDGALVFSVRRRKGLSPAKKLAQVTAERDTALARLAVLTEIIGNAVATLPPERRANLAQPLQTPTEPGRNPDDP